MHINAGGKMAKTILVAAFKGGQGKTTTAMALASMMNRAGHKTLLIDADRQMNSTDSYRVSDPVNTLYTALVEEKCTLMEAVYDSPNGPIIPGDRLLTEADQKLAGDISGLFRFRSQLEKVTDYEYVIIDTAPDMDMITMNSIVAADYVIIPVTCDRYAFQGLSVLSSQLSKAKEYLNPKIKILGILLTKYSNRTALNKGTKEAFENVAESMGTTVFNTTIRETVKVREAQATRTNLIDYAPKATATMDYLELTKEVLEKIEKENN